MGNNLKGAKGVVGLATAIGLPAAALATGDIWIPALAQLPPEVWVASGVAAAASVAAPQ